MANPTRVAAQPRHDPAAGVRDPFGNPAALAAARRRSMAERLELAISWNSVAAELRAGVAAATELAARPR